MSLENKGAISTEQDEKASRVWKIPPRAAACVIPRRKPGGVFKLGLKTNKKPGHSGAATGVQWAFAYVYLLLCVSMLLLPSVSAAFHLRK
jgi:hypothetical protein